MRVPPLRVRTVVLVVALGAVFLSAVQDAASASSNAPRGARFRDFVGATWMQPTKTEDRFRWYSLELRISRLSDPPRTQLVMVRGWCSPRTMCWGGGRVGRIPSESVSIADDLSSATLRGRFWGKEYRIVWRSRTDLDVHPLTDSCLIGSDVGVEMARGAYARGRFGNLKLRESWNGAFTMLSRQVLAGPCS